MQKCRHSRAGENPQELMGTQVKVSALHSFTQPLWIPACAGMTRKATYAQLRNSERSEESLPSFELRCECAE